MMNSNEKISTHFRIWFFKGEDKLLGKGRVELLELIKKTGSITNAAKEMRMTYRQAWQMVKEMNERATEILVEKHLGGKSGGGASITPKAEKLISSFYEIQEKVKNFINEEMKKIDI